MAEEKGKEEEPKVEKKGSALKLIIVVVVVLILAGGGFVAWQLFFTQKSEDTAQKAVSSEEQKSELDDEAKTQTFAMETFVVNLNDPGGKRYLKTNIELEYTTEQLGEELKHRLPQLRDLILLLLSSKGLEDIQTVDGKIALRRELIQRINQILTTGKIRNLYFTEFVIQ